MSTKKGGGKVINIDINQLTTRKSNINKGILAEAWNQDKFIVTDIDIDDLIPSEDNFYSLSDIDSLKDNIEEFGIQQNLTVIRRSDKKYEIIAGHRRHEGCRRLVQEGKKKFRWMPCRILPAMSETVKNILLITMNSETRKKTPAEITEEIQRLKILYTDYRKENPEFKGRIRETIAKDMGMSVANVGRHENISNNLIPEIKEKYKTEDVNFTAAVELSKLSAADQKAVYEKTGGNITGKEIKKHQNAKQAEMMPETENMNLDGFIPSSPAPVKEKELPAAPVISSEFIWAVKTMQTHLEKELEIQVEALAKARETENIQGIKNIEALIGYIGTSLIAKVQEDLFEMKGADIFKE